jgi:hypothetical protein
VSLPSPEDLEAIGYRRLPSQGDCCAPDRRPLTEVQMSLRLRIAEGKLAAIETGCREHLGREGSCCPHLAEDILAIIGGEEGEGRG